jgi:hypothetical protein
VAQKVDPLFALPFIPVQVLLARELVGVGFISVAVVKLDLFGDAVVNDMFPYEKPEFGTDNQGY